MVCYPVYSTDPLAVHPLHHLSQVPDTPGLALRIKVSPQEFIYPNTLLSRHSVSLPIHKRNRQKFIPTVSMAAQPLPTSLPLPPSLPLSLSLHLPPSLPLSPSLSLPRGVNLYISLGDRYWENF